MAQEEKKRTRVFTDLDFASMELRWLLNELADKAPEIARNRDFSEHLVNAIYHVGEARRKYEPKPEKDA